MRGFLFPISCPTEAHNDKRVMDITYVRMHEGWLYLRQIIDPYSDPVEDWLMNRRQYRTRRAARTEVFDYIECVHSPSQRRQLEILSQGDLVLTQLPEEAG